MCFCRFFEIILLSLLSAATLALAVHSVWQHLVLGQEVLPVGLFRAVDKASTMDIRQLVKAGQRKDAILCFMKKYPAVSLKEAVCAIDFLEADLAKRKG
jgi:hypothetical protein